MFVPVALLKFGTLSDYLEHLCKNRNTLSPLTRCSLLRAVLMISLLVFLRMKEESS